MSIRFDSDDIARRTELKKKLRRKRRREDAMIKGFAGVIVFFVLAFYTVLFVGLVLGVVWLAKAVI